MKYFVKFDGSPLNFWKRLSHGPFPKEVASPVADVGYATKFDGKGRAIAQVKICKLDESKITYHPVK